MYNTTIQDLTLIMAPVLEIYDTTDICSDYSALTHTLSLEHRGVTAIKSLQYCCCSYSLINRNCTISCQRKTYIWKCDDEILEIHYYIIAEIQ
jgi:hypothetical protein